MAPSSGKGSKGVQAFVLLEAKAGKALTVSRQIAKIKGVRASYAVTGPFDIIVHTEAPDFKSIAQLVVAKIQALGSVARTLTCIVVEGGEG
ncbi:MAG: Lrp/AsnC ligand binding domain-containing protein [Armatimonadota bacterium]|nr:MAG: Lrp/AsnC ligand binding domain-containing protein [Armatimonadota bacterium]